MLSTRNAMHQTDLLICGMCRGKLICDPDAGEIICPSCGAVSESNAKLSTSWSQGYGSGLTGTDSSYKISYDFELPTVIGSGNFDAHGNGIPESYELSRIRKWDNRTLSRDPKRRSLEKAAATIRRATEMLGVGVAVAEAAYEIYRRSNEGKGTRRKAISDLALASVYVALKELGVARSIHEIDEVTKELNSKNAHHYYNFLLNELKIRSTSSDAASFVSRIAAKAGLDGRTERKAIDIINQIKDNPVLISKKSLPLAASALYVAAGLCGEAVTQLRIASASEVTPVTIRKRSGEIREILKEPPVTENEDVVVQVAPESIPATPNLSY